MPRGNAKLHLVHGKGGQVFKIIDLTFANSAHFLVDHPQVPQSETLTADQRDAGIESQTELTGNEGLASTRGYIWDRAGISSEEHTSELQSLLRISYAVFCLKQNTLIH